MILGALAAASAQTSQGPQRKLERRGIDGANTPAVQPVKPADERVTASPVEAVATASKTPAAKKEAPADYILGPDDQISLWTPEAEELNNKTLRIDGNGAITIPLIGTIKAMGMTPSQLATEISTKLQKYYHKPQVVVSVSDYKSQPVSVFGSVNTPGVLQVQGRKNLIEILSMAGGVKQDAGPMVIITRQTDQGPIPVDNATTDPSGKFSMAQIDLKSVTNGERPQDNIAMKPNDLITVPKAHLVYVLGEVERSGGFVLTERDGVSMLQALSMAGGMKGTAAGKNARIIRKDETGPKEGVPVNLSAVLEGKEPDTDLRPDDILYVPNSRSKRAAIRAAEAAIQTLTGVAIWRVGSRN